ncbi:hypothetical protein GCM10009839_48830 [Catenulispora yoronensis]|uniref:Uncharacterized protein n=1 Tax=Catenulispora yoronensis TaxID=450799 RepID=A0ABP5GAI4_9ACTN
MTSSTTGTTAAADTTSTAGAPATPPAGGDTAKAFCDDYRNLAALQQPQIGGPVPPSTLAVFDRLAVEAPAPVKDAMKQATTAVHGMSGKVDAAGLAKLGTAIGSVTAWAANTANCPVS